MKRVWTPKMITLLREVYPKYKGKELQRFFPMQTAAAIKTKATILGIKKEKQRFRYTLEQLEILKRDYANTDNSVFVEKFGCSLYAVYNAAYRYGLKKSEKYMSDLTRRLVSDPEHGSRKTQFRKGSIPPNKGKKMPLEIYEKSKHTFFQKGHIPQNAVPDGAERIRNNKGFLQILIKVPGKRKLQPKNRYLWEQHNGKIPTGHNIQYRDGNPLNCDISNLYIISRSEQIHNNSIMHYPEEVKTAIRRVNKIIQLTKNQ